MAIINNLKLLPKSIESKMNARDLKKYTKLQKEWKSVLEIMIKAEQKSVNISVKPAKTRLIHR